MSAPKPRFTISIACYNNLELTRKCLASVLEHSPDAEVIVTNNASTDGTTEYLATLPNVGVIANTENQGFIRPHNNALGFARGDYFVVLNNDIEVTKGWLEKMYQQFILNPNLAIVGLQGNCCSLDENFNGFMGDKLEYVEASCLMVPTWLVKKHGLFSSYLNFAYGEDSDLSLRMRELGYQIAVVELPMVHQRAATAKLVENTLPLHLYRAGNHAVLKERWKQYLQRRNFNHSILIKRRGAHGDVLLITPIAEALKQKWGGSTITVATDYPEIFATHPFIKAVHTDKAGTDYDHVFELDLAYENQPTTHIVEAYAKVCGVDVANWKLHFFVPKEAREYSQQIMVDEKWIAIHPGPTAWAGRNWPKENFEELAKQLRQQGWHIACIGSGDNWQLENANLNLVGKTSLERLAAIIENSDLFIGIDSLPMHLSQAAVRPTIGLFGTINPKYRLLDIPFIRGVHADPEKVPCVFEHHRLPPGQIDSHCDGACMKAITVEQVLAEVPRVLHSYQVQLETSKIREQVLTYCEGRGIDIGCLRDKIKDDAVGFDKDNYPEVDVVGDASKPLPFADQDFDYVYSSHCLEDIADTKGTLKEWLRILKADGHIILYLPHKELYHGFNADHKHDGFTEEEITKPLEELGCEIVECYRDEAPDHYSLVVVAKKK